MSIITSDLVDAKYDVFWNGDSSIIMDAAPKPVLIIINGYEKDNAEGLQLHKMLEACKLAPEQYNIVQLKKDRHIAWHKLYSALKPEIVLLIGTLPVQLGINALFKLNEPNNFNNKIWLPTLSISELEQHADAKKKLWMSGMKPVFIDKIFGDLLAHLPE